MALYKGRNRNAKDMATITLEYDGRNSAIKQFIEMLFTLGAREGKRSNLELE